ncbi:MAG: hypothetical protein R3E31_13595 [Chloroflexota bacterium]
MQNLSDTLTDTLDVMSVSEGWSTEVMTPTLTLGPCMVGQTAVTVTVPATAADDMHVDSVVTGCFSQRYGRFHSMAPPSENPRRHFAG